MYMKILSRKRDVQSSNRVGQFQQEIGKIETQDESNLHGYDVSGNTHMTSAFTVTKNTNICISIESALKYVYFSIIYVKCIIS